MKRASGVWPLALWMQQGVPKQPEAKLRGIAHTTFRRRRGRLYFWLVLPTLLLSQVVLWARALGMGTGPASRWILPAIFTLVVATVAFVWIYSIVQNRSARRAFVKSKGRTCTGCLYDLNGMGETGVCAECGHAFDVESDARAWRLDGIAWPGDDGAEGRVARREVRRETRGE